jgi:hypothetical protein
MSHGRPVQRTPPKPAPFETLPRARCFRCGDKMRADHPRVELDIGNGRGVRFCRERSSRI